MYYYDHAVLSAHKFNCNIEDVIKLHKIMDSSKHHFVNFTHRMFSHNTWFVEVLVDLIGDIIPNTKTGGYIPTRDILHEHIKEDLNGECPTIGNWMENIKLEPSCKNTRWINHPRNSDIELLKELKK